VVWGAGSYKCHSTHGFSQLIGHDLLSWNIGVVVVDAHDHVVEVRKAGDRAQDLNVYRGYMIMLSDRLKVGGISDLVVRVIVVVLVAAGGRGTQGKRCHGWTSWNVASK